jgi:replicative DNA helicase
MRDELPQFVEGEKLILGALLLDSGIMQRVSRMVGVQDFYRESHRVIFQTITKLIERDAPVDLATVTAELRTGGRLEVAGGVDALLELSDCTPSSANVMHYAAVVKEKSVLRGLISAANRITVQCYSAEPGDYHEILRNVEEISLTAAQAQLPRSMDTGEPRSVNQVLHTAIENIEARYNGRVSPYGLTTGFKLLDQMTGGFHPGELIIIAGRPGMGKTAFGLAIALEAVKQCTTIFFSLEMSEEQVGQRLLSRKSAVNLRHLRTGQVQQNDYDRIISAAGDLSECPLWIDDTNALSPAQIRFRLRSLASRQKTIIGAVIVDYLQLIKPTKKWDSREREVASISKEMKGLAKEMKCPVVVLSQLNRDVEKRADKRPILSDLRESGSLEQDADAVIFVFRPERYSQRTEDQGKAEVIVAKQRNGPVGTIDLRWMPETATFWDLP